MMKYTLFLLLAFNILIAQDHEPAQRPFNLFGNSNYYIDPDTSSYFNTDNEILLGWQWDESYQTAKYFNTNFTTQKMWNWNKITNVYTASFFDEGARFLAGTGYLAGDIPNYFCFTNLQSMWWEPTLLVGGEYDLDNFRFADENHLVSGFLEINGEIPVSYPNENYSRLILRDTMTPGLVLSGAVFQDRLKFLPDTNRIETLQSSNLDTIITINEFNGTEWILSINLRRLNEDDTTVNSDNVLKIKLPWESVVYDDTLTDTGYIKFSQMPSSSLSDTITISYALAGTDYRGKEMDMVNGFGTQEIIIKNSMIPVHDTVSNPDITIHAKFLCDDVNNPYLNPGDEPQNYPIENLGIEVEYLGNLSVAIDWIRIESPLTSKVYKGMIDDTVINYHQDIFDHFTQSAFTNKDVRLVRLHDLHEYPMANWGMIRYFNNLIGRIITSETESNGYEKHFDLFINPPNRWVIKSESHAFTAVPYLRNRGGQNDPYKLGYKWGFTQSNGCDTCPSPKKQILDTLSSGYETALYNNWHNGYYKISEFEAITDLELYEDKIKSNHFFQSMHDLKVYENFIKTGLSHMYYSKKYWWHQNQVLSRWRYLPSENHILLHYDENRPQTKEEFTFYQHWATITGAKAFIYDGQKSNNFDTKILNGNYDRLFQRIHNGKDYFDLIDTTGKTEIEILSNDTLGSDFLSPIYDPTLMNLYIDFDSVSYYSEIPKDRIYLGRTTIRREIRKFHDWVRLVEDTLINLRFKGIYSNGFKTHLSQSPDFKYHDNFVLEDYLNLDNIKTRRVFRPNLNLNHNASPDYEHIDSSFFDITLLNHKNEKIIHNKYNDIYLGVINRRTDPLIFNDSAGVKKEMQFYSGAEFDDFVRDNNSNNDLFGVSRDSSWWQTQWWRRLGAREISIPFNMKPFGNAKYIEIKELGVDSLDNLGWWYWDPFYHKIDTVLMHNRTLKMNLLPGQGKLLHLSFKSIFSNSCDACDQFNDFENFNISFEPDSNDACCFNLSFLYSDLECDLNDLNLRVIVEGTNDLDLDFESNQFQDSISTSRYFFDFDFDLGRLDDSVFVGQLCVPNNSESYKVEFMIGKDTLGEYSACDRKAQYEISCNEEVKDCCDSIEVSTEYYEYGIESSSAEGCCTDFYLKSFNSNECIYGMDLVFENRVRKSFAVIDSVPLTYNIIDSVKIGSFCMPMSICYHEGPEEPDPVLIPMQLKFYASDSTEICSKTIEIEACCIWAVLDGDIESDIILEKQIFNEGFNKSIDPENKNYIYPNPNNGNFTLSYFSNNSSKVNINLIDINGQVKLSLDNVDVISGNNQIPIDNSNLTTGYYYIIIKNRTETVTVPFIVEN